MGFRELSVICIGALLIAMAISSYCLRLKQDMLQKKVSDVVADELKSLVDRNLLLGLAITALAVTGLLVALYFFPSDPTLSDPKAGRLFPVMSVILAIIGILSTDQGAPLRPSFWTTLGALAFALIYWVAAFRGAYGGEAADIVIPVLLTAALVGLWLKRSWANGTGIAFQCARLTLALVCIISLCVSVIYIWPLVRFF